MDVGFEFPDDRVFDGGLESSFHCARQKVIEIPVQQNGSPIPVSRDAQPTAPPGCMIASVGAMS